ncbi:glutaminase domain-containing protein [Dactylosporangium sp. NPDC051541]|uniref:glutaminase domain-containing protein n=1 Tax=Dactylosporangium sp. NPDC051541 TaxID=3363977 RepID=UPI003787FADD
MNPPMHPTRRDLFRLAALGGVAGTLIFTEAEAAHAATTFSPIRPPATPLAVRSPYLSTWLRADNLPGNWPTFWAGAVTAMTGIVRVDGQPYVFMGAPSGGWPLANQTSLTVTATRSTFTITAGPVRLDVEFFSPVDPASLRRQSVPMSYLSITATATDSGSHQVSLYVDVSGEWAHGDRAKQISWSTQTAGTQRAHSFQPSAPSVLAEFNDQASWGTVVFSTDDVAGLTWQTGADATVRAAAANTGALPNTADANQPRAINASWPVFAFNRALGAVTAAGSGPVVFVIGHVRTPAVSYLGTPLDPYWRTQWATWPDMLAWFRADLATAKALGAALDAQLTAAAKEAANDQYAALCALVLRQAFGGTELVSRNGAPWVMLKEISSNGDFSTVDLIYPAFPAYLQVSPRWLELLLAPIFDYTEVQGFDKPFAPHDLGVYPNAFGRIGQDEEDMPVEESANMLIMVATLLTRMPAAKASAYASAHYAKLKSWADYLVANLPDPGNQNQTDDFTGFIAHSVNLALKGIVGIGAMHSIARWAGQTSTYSGVARQYISQWVSMGRVNGHLKLTYDGADSTWSLKYNGYADRVVGTNLVPPAIAAEEANWYLQHQHAYGVPLDPRHTYTKVDWELFTAAWLTGQTAARDMFIAKAYTFANSTPSRVPFSDWHDTDSGNANGFTARPVMGATLALLTLRHRPGGLTDVVRGDNSFTVMARVNPSDLTGFRTALSQDGSRVSGFYLQYSGSDQRWAFAMTAADADNAASTRALSTAAPVLNTAVHLAGVYDAEAGQLRLYVNGALQGQASFASGWPATGPLVTGRGKWNGAAADTFAGTVADVRAYDHALPATTIAAAAGLATSRVAAFEFDAADAALTLSGGAALGGGYSGSGLQLNGSTGFATAARLVDTAASFSVSAWVQLAAVSNFATVAAQDGATQSGFYLQYSAADNAWAFAMVAADSANAAATRAVSPFPPRVDGWTHLVGVRDASAGRLRLYADGVLVADAAMGASWAAGGAFTIGRGKWNGANADHFPGRIDQVRVWTRALTDADVRAL